MLLPSPFPKESALIQYTSSFKRNEIAWPRGTSAVHCHISSTHKFDSWTWLFLPCWAHCGSNMVYHQPVRMGRSLLSDMSWMTTTERWVSWSGQGLQHPIHIWTANKMGKAQTGSERGCWRLGLEGEDCKRGRDSYQSQDNTSAAGDLTRRKNK